MKTLWKIMCEEDEYPGMWLQWYKKQCVAVGWAPEGGYKLNEKHRTAKGWNTARKAINKMEVGDLILVTLEDNKIGRLGEVVGKAIEDNQWEPFVPIDDKYHYGEIGRRILVRWELTTGPDDPDMVIQLPEGHALRSGDKRHTVSKIKPVRMRNLRKLMNDQSNWVGLFSKFNYEKALSDYIATYPHRLEDGLLRHPSKTVREHVFEGGSRSDVLLADRDGNPVVVECKQDPASVEHIKQLRGYMERAEKETQKKARGILVHAGSQKLPADVIWEANKRPKVEIVCYRLRVEFPRSTT
ncbi:MAG: endonuclease NucS domain-containing protein [Sedimentisphaerales bacterium]